MAADYAFSYPYLAATTMPLKNSVTAVEKAAEDTYQVRALFYDGEEFDRVTVSFCAQGFPKTVHVCYSMRLMRLWLRNSGCALKQSCHCGAFLRMELHKRARRFAQSSCAIELLHYYRIIL